MKIDSKSLALYRKIEDNGWPEEAIVIYKVSPYEQHVKEESEYPNYVMEYKYRHIITINFWLFYLRVTWIDKNYAPLKESRTR